jgi:hypothetical protein
MPSVGLTPDGAARAAYAPLMTDWAQRYRYLADEAQHQADRALNPAVKEEYSKMAQVWRKLAEDVEASEGGATRPSR